MEKKIKEIADYFRKEIVKGNYKFLKATDVIAEIIVDNRLFKIWIANGYEHLYVYVNFEEENIIYNEIKFRDDEKYVIFVNLESKINESKIKLRKEKIEKLQNELKKLEI